MEIQKFLKFSELDINNKATPSLMTEYYNFKKECPDFILFMQVGDFFETYFEDAVLFSNTCSITLTKKAFKIGNVHMAGVNKNSIDSYLEKMIALGFRVALVVQTDKTDEKGKVIRKLSKTFTKGCLVDLKFLNPCENNYLASIFKKNNLYEFAYTDISTGEFFYSKCEKFEIECELARLKPKEVLVPVDFEINDILNEIYKIERLNENFYEGNKNNLALLSLINYAKYILKDFYPNFEDIKEYNIKNLLLMDFQTRKNLELIENSYNSDIKGSLLYSLDTCKTPMGKRLLSSIISTPLYNLAEIYKRQESIYKFCKNKEIFEKISFCLENMGDISRISAHMSNSSISPVEFLTVMRSLAFYNEFIKIKKELNINWLNTYSFENEEILSDFYSILNRTLVDDIEEVKLGNYIKEGTNSELDSVRDELKKDFFELDDYEKTLILKTGIKSLKIVQNKGSYYIEISSKSTNPKGDDFVIINRGKNTNKYITSNLLALEEKIFSNQTKIREISKNIFKNLKEFSKEIVPYVRKYSKIISVFDVLCAFYVACNKYKLIKPEISPEKEFKISKIRNLAAEKYINDYEAVDFDFDKNSIILTGKNGIGKSTLLKSLGILICLSQTGSFVPVENAKLPLVDKIFSILNVGDEIINKKSNHQMQMHLVSNAFKNAGNKSLLLFDEIGKHTSYKDGLALSLGILKYTKNINAKYIFSTHFLEIKNYLNEDYYKFYYMNNDNGKRELTLGVASDSSGIDAAKLQNIPSDIIESAEEIYNIL